MKAAAVLALALLTAVPAWAGAPTDQLKANIDRVIQTLEDPALKAPARGGERRTALRRIADETFSFEEVSRRALGLHWQRRTPAEREEFVRLFADLLERSYIGKIELYSGEKVRYVGETVEDGRATVRTKIVTRQGNEVPVDYQMLPRGDRWVVYDVKIEGVSLVGNYRTQFDRIIQTSSYQTLVTKLKTSKDEALETARAGARN